MGKGCNIGVVSFILVVLLSEPQRNSTFHFPWFPDRCLAARPPVNCFVCKSKFTRKRSLEIHIKIIHEEQKDFKHIICELGQRKDWEIEKSKVIILFCNSKLALKRNLPKHIDNYEILWQNYEQSNLPTFWDTWTKKEGLSYTYQKIFLLHRFVKAVSLLDELASKENWNHCSVTNVKKLKVWLELPHQIC